MEVSYKKLNENFVLPFKGSEDAACFDCVATSVENMGNGQFKYGLGFATEFSEPGWKGVIVPRSSLSKTVYVMQNSPGQVDSDYRGEWIVKFQSVKEGGTHYPPFEVGDRICQIYFEKVNKVTQKVVNGLSETVRGAGGFGSTGK